MSQPAARRYRLLRDDFFKHPVLEAGSRQAQFGLLDRQQAGIPHSNTRGAILLQPVSGSGGRLRAATQVFQNGELWAIGRDLLVDNEYGRFLPVKPLEAAYRETLREQGIFCKIR